MKITMVVKVLPDGSQCSKCVQVGEMLERSGHISAITEVIEAREDDPLCQGMQLSMLMGVTTTPFFIVDRGGRDLEVFTIYLKLVKEVLEAQP